MDAAAATEAEEEDAEGWTRAENCSGVAALRREGAGTTLRRTLPLRVPPPMPTGLLKATACAMPGNITPTLG